MTGRAGLAGLPPTRPAPRLRGPALVGLTLMAAAAPAWAADDARIAELALCRASWLDWKNSDPTKVNDFAAYFRSAFVEAGEDGSFAPKSAVTVDGLPVKAVYPQSVGMGVGFSVVVDARFDAAKHVLEQALGKPLGKCETGEGMRSCELPIAEQRTVMLLSSDPPNDKTTLIGCYYLYEK